MSTAARFVSIGYFRDCYPITSVPGPGSNDIGEGVYFGPFTLAQAMALYWNCETINANGRTLTGDFFPVLGTNGPAAVPKDRVCPTTAIGGASNGFAQLFSSPNEFYEVFFENQVLASDGFHIPVSGFFYSGAHHVFSLNPIADTGGSALVKIATYSATIFGAGASIYLYRDSSGSAPGDPSFAMTANFFSY